MASIGLVFDAQLTEPDRLVLQELGKDMLAGSSSSPSPTLADTIATLHALNDPADPRFEPTVFTSYDLADARASRIFGSLPWLLDAYIAWGRRIVRVETDVVMLTHLLLYFATTLPSAVLLFVHFRYLHAVAHLAMQIFYMGPYTLLKHQHIHQRGVLARRFAAIDHAFPYAMDLLMGHTWNSYYYHHVKHHHVEANGPRDLSSTIRYQRDSARDFAAYVGRFLVLVWVDLPRYFLRSGKTAMGLKCGFWEVGSYVAIWAAFQVNARAAAFVFLVPLMLMRLALMAGNWGQHAFVDEDEPDSDYRSSVTLVDVSSNRFCYNDGYHTSHHLNPLRHWREHPVSFLQGKADYAAQSALVFHNIDYMFITIRLLMKDYEHLARCLVPIGATQIAMTLPERVALLKRHTRRFTEAEIVAKYKLASSSSSSSGHSGKKA
ncbi:hypothetical protein B0T22DRAFT_387624 [Podospora appendiculata]|uniref:Fatty acid desaturase domain-containing protein n=1 Tax=Podospora appendiculata TaxID=314037 RepID=A0AAE0WZW3_9PEZI|nr:hypothetical protein B0T22DRAFT_387624 [Podospora appendiculata]